MYIDVLFWEVWEDVRLILSRGEDVQFLECWNVLAVAKTLN
jgi:hypothetical protein